MYVLMDMEWVSNRAGNQCPTQLAALRVNEHWDTVDSFSTLIRPKDVSFCLWNHVAFNGSDSSAFKAAPSLYEAFNAFVAWLCPDDVLCWWHQEASDFFNMFLKVAGIRDRVSTVLCLREFVFNHLAGQECSVGNPYQLCDVYNIETPSPKHCALNDVQTIQALLKGIGFQEASLKDGPKHWTRSRETTAMKGSTVAPLLYDTETNTLHRSDCDALKDDVQYPAFFKFTNPIRRHHKPCSCCREDFLDALWDRNQDIVARSEYNYVYSTRSKIFHKRGCSHYLLAHDIQGTISYNACLRKGLRPCKHCNPTLIERPVISFPEIKLEPPKKAKKEPGLSTEERKAIGRFLRAKEERENMLKRNDLNAEDRDRVMALSQPGMAFWAAKGYSTFHCRNCAQLKGLKQLSGFSRYSDAVRAGFSPCRHCKPTAKMNAKLSIPINNKERSLDNCETLVSLCTKHCLPFEYDEQYFCLQTMVGKWKIDMSSRPVKLQHINLVKNYGDTTNYHTQPRIFLSLKDTFKYIMRHDSDLIASLEHTNTNQSLAFG